jgi:MFS family permease
MAQSSPLRSSTFRHLVAGYTVNELGNWLGDVALAILVFDRTGSALATAALFLALQIVPAAVAPLVVTRLEVLAAQRVLPAIYLVEALLFGAIAWLTTRFSLPAVLVLAAVDGVLAIAAKALTRSATVAFLRPHDAIRRGNAILNIGFSTSGAIGPALAGALVAALGPGWALLLNAGTFLAVAAILATAAGLRLESDRTVGPWGRLRAGVLEAWSHPGVRRLFGAQALALVFFMAVIPIEVVYAKRTLTAGDAGYGALLAAWGVGMVIGGGLYAVSTRAPLLLVLAASTALIGFSYAGFALAPNLAVACACSLVGGLGNGAQFIAFVTAVQQAVSNVGQSSVMALLESMNQVMPAIGFLLGGAITALASPRITYAVAAAGVILVLLVACARPPVGLDAPAPGTALR